ncbi:MAG: hypothetical protein ACTHNY_04650 [Solirubrobacterales bacterium]
MEALLKKEGTVENWNDERLNELSRRMDAGFNEIRKEINEGFAEVATRKEVQALDDRIFNLMIMMLVFCGGLVTALVVAVLNTG